MKILELLTPKRITGNYGERQAANYLRRHGYRIKKRNYVAAGAEIDLIAKDKNTTVFVEVKTRREGHENPREARPASAVTPEKQRKIIAVARAYMRREHEETRMRFDIVEVILFDRSTPKVKEIRHLISAFSSDTAYRK